MRLTMVHYAFAVCIAPSVAMQQSRLSDRLSVTGRERGASVAASKGASGLGTPVAEKDKF